MGRCISRRDFIRTSAAASLALAYGERAVADSTGMSSAAAPAVDPPGKTRAAMVRARDGLEAVNRAIEIAGGLDFVKPGDSVLIKPAMNSSNAFPATTDPAVVALVVRLCAERGASRIVVADKPFFLKSASAVLYRSGIGPAARKAGAEVLPLDRAEWVVTQQPAAENWGGRFLIPAVVREVDHIIYLPTVRTHAIAHFTMSLKNSVGLIGKRNCAAMHMSRTLPERIAEINLAVRPAFFVLDGRKVFVEGGPDSGLEREPGIVIAGTDPVACDTLGLAVLKTVGTREDIQQESVWNKRMIRRAVEIGLGVGKADLIDVVAEGISEQDKIMRNLA